MSAAGKIRGVTREYDLGRITAEPAGEAGRLLRRIPSADHGPDEEDFREAFEAALRGSKWR